MIDVAITATVSDGRRRFTIDVEFATDAAFAVLYGPSGAGKSLTLRAIAGLLRPQRGRIRIADRTLFDSTAAIDLPAARRGVGYLFQDFALFPHLSVADNVAFGLRSWRRRRLTPAERQRVETLLAAFGLTELATSRPAALSGGQQQRVALARALACDPQALLLDEPFASLNAMLRRNLRAELATTRRAAGIPALMITHDIDDVLALAETVFIYDQGRVVDTVDLRYLDAAEAARRLGVDALLLLRERP
ncbi:MAG: ABC transporter ATP-binding protein [Lautropia sp.]